MFALALRSLSFAKMPKIPLANSTETPNEGYVNLRIDPLTMQLIVKFSTDKESQVGQIGEANNASPISIDGGNPFGTTFNYNAKGELPW